MADEFIGLGTEADPDDIVQDAFDYLSDNIDSWEPHAANLEVVLLQALAQEAAVIRDLAAQTGIDIFRFFGELIGTPARSAAPAAGFSDWSLADTDGHEIAAGTQFALDGPTGQIAFQTLNDVLVNPGSDLAEGVAFEAVEPGIEGNDLSGDGVLLDPLIFVLSITVADPTSGGEDEESDTDYLDRLSERLTLQSPRPILPRDFEILARDIAGVARALAYDGYIPGTNEQQAVTNDASSGTFTLTFDTQTTGNIDFDADASDVQTALEALSNIDPGDVVVTGGPLPALITIEFTGQLRDSDQPTITADDTNLVGGTSTITTPVTGVPAEFDQERVITLFLVDEDGEPVSGGIASEVQTYLDGLREINFVVYTKDPLYEEIDVTVDVAVYDGFDVDGTIAAVEASLTDYFEPKNWGLPFAHTTVTDWINETKVRYLEVAEVVNRTEGVHFIETLTVEGGTSDIDLSTLGDVVLTRPGTFTVTGALG